MIFNDEYEKLRLIGKGAFAAIWKVRHRRYGYIRAVKVSNEVVEDEQDKAYQTFLKECRVLLQIGNGCHPNIVHIYQPRLIENQAMVEMDYVEGCTLEQYVARQRFITIDEVMRFARQIVGALAYCHVDIYQFLMNPADDHLECDPDDARRYLISPEKREELVRKYRVTHNDLHSNNVMRRDYDGAFVLLDFGLSIQDGHSVKSSSRRDGAVEYKAPEKWEDRELTPQTDVYGLGILLFQMLAGRLPFPYEQERYANEMEGLNALYHDHMETPPPAILPLRKAAFEATHPGKTYVQDYPDRLEHIIRRCLEKDPQRRYPDAKALLADLETCMPSPSGGDGAQVQQLQTELWKQEEEKVQMLQHINFLENIRTNLEQENHRLTAQQVPPPPTGKPRGCAWKMLSLVLFLLAAVMGAALWYTYHRADYYSAEFSSSSEQAQELEDVNRNLRRDYNNLTDRYNQCRQELEDMTMQTNELNAKVETLQAENDSLKEAQRHSSWTDYFGF